MSALRFNSSYSSSMSLSLSETVSPSSLCNNKQIRVISCSDDHLVLNKPANLRMDNKIENDKDIADASSVEEQSSAWLSKHTFKGLIGRFLYPIY
jgi:hypothetical protein